MTPKEQLEVKGFVGQCDHGWTHQPTARVVNAGFPANPEAECIEITVMEGHSLSEATGDYKPVQIQVFSMAGARIALGY